MQSELKFGDIIGNAFSIGMKNALVLFGALFLWIITFWIPYLNVGTTIALVGIAAKLGRGESISPLDIFDAKYRKHMGEYFLVMIFMLIGTYFGMVFLFIPGIVIGLAWSLAVLLVIDKGLNPMEALNRSNELTYGKKWTLFFGYSVLMLIGYVVLGALFFVGSLIHIAVAAVLGLVGFVFMWALMMGALAYVYGTLVDGGVAAPAPPVAPAEPVPSAEPVE
jgi:hypothetical protein